MGQSDNNNRIELYSFLEILRKLSHMFPYDKNVLEIGSMNGNDAKFLADNLGIVNSNVHIVDANPMFASEIRKNHSNYQIHEFAICSKNGKIYFNAAKDEDDGRSSIFNRDIYKNDNFEKIEVNAMTGKSLLEKCQISNVFALKLDVEGAAFEVLESFEKSIENIFAIQVETERSQVWDEQKTIVEVFGFLEKMNFSLAWSCDVGIQNDSIWINRQFL
jgi:FkbM family methyltransferase